MQTELNVEATPTGRIVYQTPDKLVSRTLDVNKRVAYSSPTQDRCIVENTPNCDGIELCHVFGRANSTDDTLMSSIEFNWDILKYGLNLDSRRNCIFAGALFHAKYDKGRWCLVPPIGVLQDLLKATKTGDRKIVAAKLKDIHDLGTYTYTLVPIHYEMGYKPIVWQTTDRPQAGDDDLIIYKYPFNKPVIEIESHVYPEFIVLSIGLHMAENPLLVSDPTFDQSHLDAYTEHFKIISTLYRTWTKPLTDAQKIQHKGMAPRIQYQVTDDEMSDESDHDDPNDKCYRAPRSKKKHATTSAPTTRSTRRSANLTLSSTTQLDALIPNGLEVVEAEPKVEIILGVNADGQEPDGPGSGRVAVLRKMPSSNKRKERERSVSPSPTSRRQGPGEGSSQENDLMSMLTSAAGYDSDTTPAAPAKSSKAKGKAPAKASKAKRKVAPLPRRSTSKRS
ncbi:hypothetical protein CVT24_008968 [Panaeolus cyanescens]|uniref:HNH nuclease domain-containing protein n=1 Tax=Panaeolus cyanescens TaxID=181874 RepID=A0A409YAT5_9AGAR|nr:hypothetical protein CVT24_008968 [Panaeolus cyanescens]